MLLYWMLLSKLGLIWQRLGILRRHFLRRYTLKELGNEVLMLLDGERDVFRSCLHLLISLYIKILHRLPLKNWLLIKALWSLKLILS